MRNIFQEVDALGPYEGEDFIKREFLMDLDGDKSNKEEHVVVICRGDEAGEEMLVQITYFKLTKLRYVRRAERSFCFSCYFSADGARMKTADFDYNELVPLLKKILKGVREEIKLLKLIEKAPACQ